MSYPSIERAAADVVEERRRRVTGRRVRDADVGPARGYGHGGERQRGLRLVVERSAERRAIDLERDMDPRVERSRVEGHASFERRVLGGFDQRPSRADARPRDVEDPTRRRVRAELEIVVFRSRWRTQDFGGQL